MDTGRIARMANQIAAFFASYPEAQAVEGTEDHIRKFWDPRMRAQLIALLEAEESGLSEVALAAARRIQATATESVDSR
ncbi:MAG: formate dehydrogenase subunit delta [Acetobacterales bacterium]